MMTYAYMCDIANIENLNYIYFCGEMHMCAVFFLFVLIGFRIFPFGNIFIYKIYAMYTYVLFKLYDCILHKYSINMHNIFGSAPHLFPSHPSICECGDSKLFELIWLRAKKSHERRGSKIVDVRTINGTYISYRIHFSCVAESIFP